MAATRCPMCRVAHTPPRLHPPPARAARGPGPARPRAPSRAAPARGPPARARGVGGRRGDEPPGRRGDRARVPHPQDRGRAAARCWSRGIRTAGRRAAATGAPRCGEALATYTALRRSNLAYVGRLGAAARRQHGRHPEYGRLTMPQLLDHWAEHDLIHLEQIRPRTAASRPARERDAAVAPAQSPGRSHPRRPPRRRRAPRPRGARRGVRGSARARRGRAAARRVPGRALRSRRRTAGASSRATGQHAARLRASARPAPRAPSRTGRSPPRIRRSRPWPRRRPPTLFAAGLYFEVHEVLEPLLDARGGRGRARRSRASSRSRWATSTWPTATSSGARALLHDGAAKLLGQRLAGRDLDAFAPRWPVPRARSGRSARRRRARFDWSRVPRFPGGGLSRDGPAAPGRRRGGGGAKRRKLLPPGRLLEAWPDLYVAGQAWVGDEARALLDGAGEPAAGGALGRRRRGAHLLRPAASGHGVAAARGVAAGAGAVGPRHRGGVDHLRPVRAAHRLRADRSRRSHLLPAAARRAAPRTSGGSSGREPRRASTWPSTTAATPRGATGRRALPAETFEDLLARHAQRS